MRIVTKEFLNENAFSNYPIDAKATYEPYKAEDVSRINSLLLDMRISIPSNIANTAFVAGIKVSESLVSMVVMGVKDSTNYAAKVPPQPPFSSSEYTAFSAVVLGTVTADRSVALTQTPISISGELPGVGGWVVFGPGIENTGSWSFSGPESSMISSLAVSRYDYGGVTTVARKGFQTTLDGNISLVGQNGIEVVEDTDNTLSIKFTGTVSEVKTSLSEYKGECGRRPETDTCTFNPIKSINNIKPEESSSGVNEIVLVLDRPLYAKIVDVDLNGDGRGFEVSSDVPIESFCGTRLVIPPSECDPNGFPLTGQSTDSGSGASIPQGTQFMVEALYNDNVRWLIFNMHQQHPIRPSTSVFRAAEPGQLLGEFISELQIDTQSNQWQIYTDSGPSLHMFGPIGYNLTGSRDIVIGGIPGRVAVGPINILDKLGKNMLKVGVDSSDALEWTGIYRRKYYGHYVNTMTDKYVIKVLAHNNSWVLYDNNVLSAGGTFNQSGGSSQLQNYVDAAGNTLFRNITVVGVAE